MAKLTRCNKRYFQDTECIYMVCTALNKDGKYRWEVHTSDGNGLYIWFKEFAHGCVWKDSSENAINDAIEVLKENFPNVTEVNYTEGNLCLAGNFKDNVEIKEDILLLIRQHFPEITPYFD
jgi:hypothetical protein